jgi:NADPH:quinone reductase-like Zn-dependent oxidoreductase
VKAIRFHEYGSADVLREDDVPMPEPGPSEALIRVRACAVNHVDIDMRNGTSRLPLALPHTLGFEIAGEVAAVGDQANGIAVGDRVAPLYQIHCRTCEWCRRGEHMHCEQIRMLGVQSPGGYAEYAVTPVWALIPLPESLSFEQGAAIQTTFGTVWHALVSRVGVTKGQWVLVNAAGSGVGTAGIQVAKMLGAHVIASAGSDEKLERAREIGAEATVNYRTEDLAGRVRELTDGRGVDVVMESVGGGVLTGSLSALPKNGSVVTVGAHGGEVVPVDVILLFRHQWSLIGSVRATAEEIRHCIDLVASGQLSPLIHATLPLDLAAEAHRILENRQQFGKVVLVP